MAGNQREKIEKVIHRAIDDFNQIVGDRGRIQKDNHTLLFGDGGGLDSLGLVNLIVTIEEQIEDAFDVTINLADEKAMSRKNSPFRTIDALCDYVTERFEEVAHG